MHLMLSESCEQICCVRGLISGLYIFEKVGIAPPIKEFNKYNLNGKIIVSTTNQATDQYIVKAELLK